MKTGITISKGKILVLVGLMLAAFLVAACVPVPEANETGTEPISESSSPEIALEEAARTEGGELMVYTSMNIDDLEQILAKFEETYPFVNAEYYRASGDPLKLVEALLIEQQAAIDQYRGEQ